ncbi:MAG: hypothetical protein WCA35_21410 [Kovacikia sp.]
MSHPTASGCNQSNLIVNDGDRIAMRCSVSSGSGQVLANGQLFIQEDEEEELRLSFRTDRGKIIVGGKIDADGNLMSASKDLFRQFFLTWGVMGITLNVKSSDQG